MREYPDSKQQQQFHEGESVRYVGRDPHCAGMAAIVIACCEMNMYSIKFGAFGAFRMLYVSGSELVLERR